MSKKLTETVRRFMNGTEMDQYGIVGFDSSVDATSDDAFQLLDMSESWSYSLMNGVISLHIAEVNAKIKSFGFNDGCAYVLVAFQTKNHRDEFISELDELGFYGYADDVDHIMIRANELAVFIKND